MTQTLSSPCLVCRPALPLDTADVLEFTKFIWDGHDYVPLVWKNWLADPKGILAVAEYGGRVVGLGKVTLLAPGQWWMEGLRVDPKVQNLKIGSHIHDYVNQWWLEHGDGAVRLMTSSQRVKVQHLCERRGFRKIAELSLFAAPALAEPTDDFQPVPAEDIRAAVEFAHDSPSLAPTGGLMDLGWRFVTLDETSLAETVSKDRAWWWRGRQGLLTTWEDENPEGEKALMIGLLACGRTSIPAFLMGFRRLAARLSYPWAVWIAPLLPEAGQTLERAGYKNDWEYSGYLYEKRHPGRP